MLALAWPAVRGVWTRWNLLSLMLWLVGLVQIAHSMSDESIGVLRHDTRELFYHGYRNYMQHAFPEDELKPLSCGPQTRNRENPADIGLNDVLGNYSLTLVDSLSTLAIFASDKDAAHAREALSEFQGGIQELVRLYGDGTVAGRCGERACGFDLDSKVQVFETNIRGVGGLLSAHLFAIGELPIRNYNPTWEQDESQERYINWGAFRYNGQLLRLAHDLASRLLPAFNTTTGLPYPRVNLRHGIPFYLGSDTGYCRLDGSSTEPREITETCAAGAGSLVLEFSTLSRLTGDTRFESLAKKAFWAVWSRRSQIGLIGNGIDAESGEWTSPALAGVGAGMDSWYEYAVKSYVLLSGLPYNSSELETNDPEDFLQAWKLTHDAVKRHIYRPSSSDQHAFYGQADLHNGAPRFSWIDNLSAYYPGLLTLSGELEEAIESHLLYTALWTRYGALPERWHTYNGFIDADFKHWAGRPEFIESTYYLYQATRDPWYLHVGEMALRDIRRRCWTKCGWADLGDVISGEKRDRMESFFLGETAKYLYLLFSEDHPLNTLDAPVVFTTEGHPLTIPQAVRSTSRREQPRSSRRTPQNEKVSQPNCPAPLPVLPLTLSNIVNRPDFFHAASLAQLHLLPVNPARTSPLVQASDDGPGISFSDVRSPTNYSFYPWTLPSNLIPAQGVSAPMRSAVLSTLTFPNLAPEDPVELVNQVIMPFRGLHKIDDGIFINSLSNVRFSMVQEHKTVVLPNAEGQLVQVDAGPEYRIHGIANVALGRDEKVLLSRDALHGVSPADPHFTRVKDREMVDVVVDVPLASLPQESPVSTGDSGNSSSSFWDDIDKVVTSILAGSISPNLVKHEKRPAAFQRLTIPAILPTGIGAASLPATTERGPGTFPLGHLPFKGIYFLESELCEEQLPASVVRTHSTIVIQRGGCSFADKLANIPPVMPSVDMLQLVVVLSTAEAARQAAMTDMQGDQGPTRPLIDERQVTPNGRERRHPLAMVMVEGEPGERDALRAAASTVGHFNEHGELVGHSIQPIGDDSSTSSGLTIKRRYWFESLGIRIANLVML